MRTGEGHRHIGTKEEHILSFCQAGMQKAAADDGETRMAENGTDVLKPVVPG
jgi:hypothetical protein